MGLESNTMGDRKQVKSLNDHRANNSALFSYYITQLDRFYLPGNSCDRMMMDMQMEI